tara:strand:- start:1036 stop:1635 length:600 start_codon:yes stop_codon:yes gene_type:complete
MSKKPTIIFPLITSLAFGASSDESTVSIRGGIDVTGFNISNELIPFEILDVFPAPSASVDIKKFVNDDIAFMLSTSYSLNFFGSQVLHNVSTGLYSSYHANKTHSIGLGVNLVHSVGLGNHQNSFGSFHAIRGGINITSYLNDNTYSRVEVLHDFTPNGYRTREHFATTRKEQEPMMLSLLSGISSYGFSVSMGYDIDL